MKKPRKLIDQTSNHQLADCLEMADTFWSRFRGLMFRKDLPQGFALWIVPCKSIHTFWMRLTIDVFFCNREGVVISAETDVKPWRVVFAPKGTRSVLEAPAGTLDIPVGTQLQAVDSIGTDDI